MKKLFYRGFAMIHSFYKKIIKEGDSFMQYWYTSFAISLLTVFILNFISAVLYAITKANIFSFKYKKFLLIYGSIMVILMFLFFRNRSNLEANTRNYSSKFIWQDYFIMALIILALVSSFAAPIIYKNVN